MIALLLASPRNKLILALALLLIVGGASSVSGISLPNMARAALLVAAASAVAFWVHRSRQRAGFSLPERLQVLSRTGLSPRCGLALVEADGEAFLVAFGDGFATIRSARASRGRGHQPRALRAVDGGAR